VDGSVLVSDMLDGVLPSPYLSVDVRNNGVHWIEMVDVIAVGSVVSTQPPTLFQSEIR
jgi:hypothetical protein